MNQSPFGCAGMNGQTGSEQLPLCAPLKLLKEEHGPLREAMDAFAATAERISADPSRWGELFPTLHEQVATFEKRLKAHSRKEEDVLFPMMARYIGKDFGPIAVMEYEHSQAEKNLRLFLEAAAAVPAHVEAEEAKTMAGYAILAHSILTQHFGKEENVLFPMAENMLTPEEKESLYSQIRD